MNEGTDNGDLQAEIAKVESALKRASLRARETARRFGTRLVVLRDGKVCEVDPDEVPLPGESSESASADQLTPDD